MSQFVVRPPTAPLPIDPTPPDPVPIGPFVGGLDCSPEAQADRLRRLRELENSYYAGVSQITDRNRSVTYSSRADMVAAMNALRGQIAVCLNGCWPRRGASLYYVPQVKDL